MSEKRIIGGVDLQAGTLTGTVSDAQGLLGSVASEVGLSGSLSTAYTTHAATYDGDYEITPKAESQELKTKQKYMIDDVTVHAIPYFDVGNTSGGRTVYIGGQIEIE